MSDERDLVERLRVFAGGHPLTLEAADEIERLRDRTSIATGKLLDRAKVAEVRAAYEAEAEIERLRAQLESHRRGLEQISEALNSGSGVYKP